MQYATHNPPNLRQKNANANLRHIFFTWTFEFALFFDSGIPAFASESLTLRCLASDEEALLAGKAFIFEPQTATAGRRRI